MKNLAAAFLSTALIVSTPAIAGQSPTTPPPTPRASAPEAAQPASPRTRGDRLQEAMEREKEAIEARRGRIKTELAALDRSTLKDTDWAKEWAGVYYTGDGLGMNVLIEVAPKSGVAYTWHGCLGLYDANHGDIVETFPDGLRVKPAIPTGVSFYEYFSDRLYFVRWGERKYLVPEAKMLTLVNDYNQGGFAREDLFSIPRQIKNDEFHACTPAPAGRPQLPAKYAAMLIDKQVDLKVTKVTAIPVRPVTTGVVVYEYDLELDGGRSSGVFAGMEVDYQRGTTFGKVKIAEVGEKTCKGRLTVFTSEKSKIEAIKVGDTLSLSGSNPEPEAGAPK